ncbi:hypothetical protein V3C99_010806, partial [Haemonchus contortus]|uniref:DNA-binding protein n=1 Tax=Haemonchus contortus TaxID=6289 RepID=A0A7I4Y8X6_HAECO
DSFHRNVRNYGLISFFSNGSFKKTYGLGNKQLYVVNKQRRAVFCAPKDEK